jgi:hypothetical protein
MSKRTAISCCCAECGNCTRIPTHDNREPCCCETCGHCFREPVKVVEYRNWPPNFGLPAAPRTLPHTKFPYTITCDSSVNQYPALSVPSTVCNAVQMS